MKRIMLVLAFTFVLAGCSKEDNELQGIDLAKSACGSDMGWLASLIAKCEDDRATKKYNGAYRGSIYLGSYRNTPVIMVRMAVNATLFQAFYCDNQPVSFTGNDAVDFYNATMSSGKILYTNFP
jgi:hypothetical protein